MIPVGWSVPVELGPRSLSIVGIASTPDKQIQLPADLGIFCRALLTIYPPPAIVLLAYIRVDNYVNW